MGLKKSDGRLFDFDRETQVELENGLYLQVLVVVYSDQDWEIINMDTGTPVEMSSLPREDQHAIHNEMAEKLTQTSFYQPIECCESRAGEIRELNALRGA